MNKILYIILVAVFCAKHGYAQKNIKELTVGDQVTELPFKSLKDKQQAKISLKDYKGKLLILDFWFTGCSTCIDSWPKLQALQDHFKDQIQILIINPEAAHDTEEKLSAFFAARKKIDGFIPNLPFLNGASEFKKVFPSYSVPHIAWISGEGKVIAITGGVHLDKGNIERALKGNLRLPVKEAHKLEYDYTQPLFVNGNGGDDNSFLNRSLFSKYIKGLGSSTSGKIINKKNGTQKVTYKNVPMANMYLQAYVPDLNKLYPYDNNTGLLDVKLNDMERFKYPLLEEGPKRWDSFMLSHVYSYEVIIPNDINKNIYDVIKKDLDQFFEVNSRIELRDLKCLKLVRLSEQFQAISKGLGSFSLINDKEEKLPVTDYYRISDFMSTLNLQSSKLPMIVDETGYAGNLDISLSKDALNNLQMLRSELQKHGLDLKETIRPFNVLVIRDKESLVTTINMIER